MAQPARRDNPLLQFTSGPRMIAARSDLSANITHAGSVSFFRSNQLLTFAKIQLSATEAALDAHD